MHLPSLLAAASLLALSAPAQAATHYFTFTGFVNEATGEFVPNVNIGGRFDSEDLNGNGVHERSEITTFALNGQEYLPWCTEVAMCYVGSFSWTPGGKLDFSASWSTDPWAEYYYAGSFDTGERWEYHGNWPGSPSGEVWLWSPQTTFSITPVPEPAPYALLGAGLALLGAHARRRASGKAPSASLG